MTSTIKVDNIQNQCGANIINENSDTITIGASGDTVTLASGASQTGFGRTGTVDWQTTHQLRQQLLLLLMVKVILQTLQVALFTVNLPCGFSRCNCSFQYRIIHRTFQTNNLTITPPNGSEKINGGDAQC
jgi:hypothetical protein